MKLILLGSPGAGKGTLAAKAVDLLNVPHISTGNIFRSAMDSQTPLGLKVKAIVESGKLVDDETTIELVKERLSRDDVKNGYILDGFPRTTAQAEALHQFSVVDEVLSINVTEEEVMERLGGRRVCRKCGQNYHVVYHKPKQDDVCDTCGGELYTRDDDSNDAIHHRLEIYQAQTAPLIDYYREKGVLVEMQTRVKFEETLENFKTALGL